MLADLSPEIVYLVLLGAIWISATAIYVPGTGIFEAIALGVLAAALFVLTQHPTNWFAAALVGSGSVWFLMLPFFSQKYGKFAIAGLILQVVGSLFLFDGKMINPLMIAFVAGISLLYYQFMLKPAMKWVRLPVTDDDDQLAGTEGIVVTAINPTGTVKLRGGEAWTAYSDDPIAAGERIFVIKRDGLQLQVEHIKNKRMPQTEVIAE